MGASSCCFSLHVSGRQGFVALRVRASTFGPFRWHNSRVQFVRTTSGYASWMRAVAGFVKWCEWTKVSIVFTRGWTFKSTVMALSRELSLSEVSVVASISFDEDVDDRSLSNQLSAFTDLRSRVVVVMALETTYLKIALSLLEMGMVSGWAYLGLDTVPLAPNYAPVGERANVDQAFNGWIYFEPHFLAGRDFFDRVHNATRSDFPTLFDESVSVNPYAAAMYDAIMLFATVANRQGWQPEEGGRAFLNQSIGNLSFEGATGSVKLDGNGDSLLSYQAVNLALNNGALQRIVVGVAGSGTRSYSSNGRAIIWPGGVLARPADVSVVDAFDTKWVLVGGGASAMVVVGGVVIVVRKRHAHLQAIMALLFTEVGRPQFAR